MGATAAPNGTKTPTRLAFRWLKGLTGWSSSPLGEESANDSVPSEPEPFDDLQLPHDNNRPPEFKGSSRVQILNGSARTTPLCDQAAVDGEGDQWAKLWKEKEPYEELDWTGLEQLPHFSPRPSEQQPHHFPLGLAWERITSHPERC